METEPKCRTTETETETETEPETETETESETEIENDSPTPDADEPRETSPPSRARKPRRLWLRLIGCLVALLLVAAASAVLLVYVDVQSFLTAVPQVQGREVIVEIPQGATGRQVADLLFAEGIVTDADRFYMLLRYREAAPGIRAGEFTFRTDWTPDEVIDALHNAPEVTYPLTVREGLRYTEVARLVAEAGRGWSEERFLELCRDADLVARMDADAEDLEGYLFPETYRFSRHATETDVIEAMLHEFGQHFGPDEQARADELGMTQHEVVILASLVEKETGAGQERAQVSSVFHNRLRIGMKLECDPTIIYGIEDYDGVIHRSDIANPHPWNTYVHAGLPKGPIANPGAAAIRAALYPDETKYLYFVSRNDGTHHFSTTYAEHARMVQRYQR